jgi:hypothetical protein
MTAAATSAVGRSQLPQRNGPLLVFEGLRALFSQVNNDLRDMLPNSRGLSPSCQERFMIG